MVFQCCFSLHSLMTRDFEHIFICYWPYISLKWLSNLWSVILKIGLLLFPCKCSSYSVCVVCKYFLLTCNCVSQSKKKLRFLMKFSLPVFSLMVRAFWELSQKLLFNVMIQKLSPMRSFRAFIV